MPLPKSARKTEPHLPWLEAGQAFPAPETAWGSTEPVPGLLAAGDTLDAETLRRAYSNGIFPWFSLGQPVLWWSPDPRMVLKTDQFRLHRSLRKSIVRFASNSHCEIRVDSAFQRVISACARQPRAGQSGTWIVSGVEQAYGELHRAGHAHSVETWVNGELAGGLYCVNLGRMVFGESMFADQTDASKIALAALVAFCRAKGMAMIDCQQKTSHLATFGAAEISRSAFANHLRQHVGKSAPDWNFDSLYWQQILTDTAAISAETP
ncbi:MAG: Leucyltransferase [Polaromonas sp.]|jgi:leucyl/phenylalanyl-tRNA--protein transferase|nr:Leucyltransferase [Polaromonas sp.]